MSHYLIADGSNEDAHQRAEDIEETIGQIGERGNAQYRGLRHAAGVPRHEDGSDGNGIFRRATQQAALVTLTVIDILKHISRQQDTQILICHRKIHHHSGAGC